jgi:CDP-glycerol glycerophosphotransferase
MPKISVIVPVYNVEEYLDECLTSIERQTMGDLEIVVVDDGSTDGSAAIARAHAERDPRIRIVTRPNGGLSAARNTGIEHATGEYLAFVDSDDLLVPNAYELLLGSLEETGSDFATGNVHRLTVLGTNQAPFLARAFGRDRAATHVRRFDALLTDRIVPNKLWRRSFWDAQGFRFPEGMLHEDIPVVIPAHVLARAVDVIATPVYLYRVREGIGASITQRRTENKALLDRLRAINMARATLAEHGRRRELRAYEDSVIAEDVSYYLKVYGNAGEEWRDLFIDGVNELLDSIGRRRVLEPLPAIDRVKYHFIRRRMKPELLELVRFEREDMAETPPVRLRGRWYGDYPFRGDRELRVPLRLYRLRRVELPLIAQLDELRFDGDTLRVGGFGYIRGLPADRPGSERVTVSLVRGGRGRRLRLALGGIRLRTHSTERPEATEHPAQALHDVSWSGFAATLPARRMRLLWRWRYGRFDLYLMVRAGGLRRRRVRFLLDPTQRLRADEYVTPDGTMLKAVPSRNGRVQFQLLGHWARLCERHRDGDEIVIGGELRMPEGASLALELAKVDGAATRTYPLTAAGPGPIQTFEVRVPLADLDVERELEVPWRVRVMAGERHHQLTFPAELPAAIWQAGEREISLSRSGQAGTVLEDRRPRALLTDARWTPDGDLELEGQLHAEPASHRLVLVEHELLLEHELPLAHGDGLLARLALARLPSLAGELPLRAGSWQLLLRRAGAVPGSGGSPVMLAEALHARLPLTINVDNKPFALGTTRDEEALVVVGLDLAPDERGPYHQRRLRDHYRLHRSEPLRDAVVYTSFNGRQCSDSPRAIHDELVRRAAPLEHLWVVWDGMARVPAGATKVRRDSREHREALARARYVVSNDHFPGWFRRRDDQVCVQTWHGTPLKALGFDVLGDSSERAFAAHWDDKVRNWQYVVSPNRFTTPILRTAYRLPPEAHLLETGYPRNDVLAADGREERSRALRERLGLPAGVRTVLYAPTFRDHLLDFRKRYRMDLQLDVARLRAALGDDVVILFRKHHYVVDPVPVTADGFVRDVSGYPDGTELLLAADVLVTDYSSLMFDYANTGRPMLFFTYDLDSYRDEVRGFYFDFLERAPGPLMRTSEELADALSDLDGVRSSYAERYAAFAGEFCEFDDGHAAARVVDRVFEAA